MIVPVSITEVKFALKKSGIDTYCNDLKVEVNIATKNPGIMFTISNTSGLMKCVSKALKRLHISTNNLRKVSSRGVTPFVYVLENPFKLIPAKIPIPGSFLVPSSVGVNFDFVKPDIKYYFTGLIKSTIFVSVREKDPDTLHTANNSGHPIGISLSKSDSQKIARILAYKQINNVSFKEACKNIKF